MLFHSDPAEGPQFLWRSSDRNELVGDTAGALRPSEWELRSLRVPVYLGQQPLCQQQQRERVVAVGGDAVRCLLDLC